MGAFSFLVVAMKLFELRQVWFLLALVAGVVFVYLPGLQGAFFFDDETNLLRVADIQITELSIASFGDVVASGRASVFGRPLSMASFSINYFYTGLDPFYFKLTNLILHCLAGVLAFFAARTIFIGNGSLSERIAAERFALMVAALWLLHPIQLLSVLHVTQRMTILSGAFLLLAFWGHVSARQTRKTWLLLPTWGLVWPIAVASKETALLLPLFVFAWELTLRRSAVGALDGFARYYSYFVLCISVLVVIYIISPYGNWLFAGYEMREFGLAGRVLTEARVFWLYLAMILTPWLGFFSLYHDDIVISTSLAAPWETLPAVCGVAGLIVATWWCRTRQPTISFGIAWFLIGHLLESTVLPLEIAHEHRNYIPLFGVVIVLTHGLRFLISGDAPWKRYAGVALFASFLAYAALLTGLRAHQYGDEIRRTQIDAQFHPLSWRSQYDAGRALSASVTYESRNLPIWYFAATHYERAKALNESAKAPLVGLMYLECSVGEALSDSVLDELESRLRSRPFSPGDLSVLVDVKNLTLVYPNCLKRDDAERVFRAAIANENIEQSRKISIASVLLDYLVLAAQDFSMADKEVIYFLGKFPSNTELLLKGAQVAYLRGELGRVKELLSRVEMDKLNRSQREIAELLLSCMTDMTRDCSAVRGLK